MVTDACGDYYYLNRELASPEALLDANGHIVESYDYDAYGRVTVTNERLRAVGCRYLEVSAPPVCSQAYALKVVLPVSRTGPRSMPAS